MRQIIKWAGVVSRTLLGIVFLFSGFVKAVDPLGTVYKIEDYLKAFGGFFTDLMPLATVAAIGLITFEWILGVLLAAQVWPRVSRWGVVVMMLVMTPLTLYIALTNPVSDCGCFGDALVLTNWQTFWKNIVLSALAAVLFLPGATEGLPCERVTRTRTYSIGVTIAGLIFVGGFMAYNLTHLPVIDFRPYKIGNNIPALMEVPEDAPQDVYETTLIYERDGVEQEFTLSNYPKGDSTWTFVDQHTQLISKGYEAPIHDFEITTEDYEDITYDVLEAERATLIIMYRITRADYAKAEAIQALYEACEERGEMCYILTGAPTSEVDAYVMTTGITCPICTTDPVTLKTIVRANPGMIELEMGTIVKKERI